MLLNLVYIEINYKGGKPNNMQEFTNESGIYKCTCLSNGRSYIGQTCSLFKRKNDHINRLKNNKHYNKHLQRAWNKYGEENFIWEVLEICPVEQLNEREKYWIEYYDAFKTGFNQTSGGDSGFDFSEELKQKNRERMLGTKNHMYGRRQTEEAKEINRLAHFGANNAIARAVICIETNEVFLSIADAGRAKNCDPSTISKVCIGKKKTTHGYHWRYATQEEIEQYKKLHNKEQNQINNIAS